MFCLQVATAPKVATLYDGPQKLLQASEVNISAFAPHPTRPFQQTLMTPRDFLQKSTTPPPLRHAVSTVPEQPLEQPSNQVSPGTRFSPQTHIPVGLLLIFVVGHTLIEYILSFL